MASQNKTNKWLIQLICKNTNRMPRVAPQQMIENTDFTSFEIHGVRLFSCAALYMLTIIVPCLGCGLVCLGWVVG